MQFTFKREAMAIAIFMGGLTLLGLLVSLLIPILVRWVHGGRVSFR